MVRWVNPVPRPPTRGEYRFKMMTICMKGVNFMKNKPKSNAGGGCDRCGSFFNGIRDVIIIGTQYNIWLEKCSVL